MTGDNSLYKYILTDAPQQKIDYSYAKFGGERFLDDYKKSRNIALLYIDRKQIINEISKETTTQIRFHKWINLIEKGQEINENELLLLLKRFEVTKKIFESYDSNFRPIDKGKYQNYELYVLFAEIMVLAYSKYRRLQYLNTLLKVNDIILGLIESLSEQLKKKTALNIKFELEFTNELKKELSE